MNELKNILDSIKSLINKQTEEQPILKEPETKIETEPVQELDEVKPLIKPLAPVKQANVWRPTLSGRVDEDDNSKFLINGKKVRGIKTNSSREIERFIKDAFSRGYN